MPGETDWGGAPPVLRKILGRQLEDLRKRAGLSFNQAGDALGVSHSTIRRIEAAKVSRLRLSDVQRLLETYGVRDPEELHTFLQAVREANKQGWWHTYRDVLPDWVAAYLSLEQAARQIRAYEAQFVHGLLQTESYARALIVAENPHATPEAIERRVALRMRRQELLHREDPPRLWVVMDETVLRWPVGGREVMARQIDHLREMTALPQVTLQIMRFARGPHPAMPAGAFHLFRFRAPELPDVVYLSSLIGAVYLDGREDVMVYREVLDRLGAQAAPDGRTAELLDDVRKEL
ncbi:helix-turn-helix domain-containing protein [Streptomyces profundus]|uniref:helix-turn-helix domain-containing protein n=1 Tax=Streptomyces profundus TaxID=2867410 RepID=UPI001D16CF21|nr:helix-turn-helix transcriptional regulator [Streptomyces sp. MA3_2.13]UED88082.1 helix-turn-helix domain-containing protein [Streptomyces sp. MA3_2.13]